MVLVYLVHAGGRWSPWDTHYIPDPRTPVLRISEPANYRESADDPATHTVLCAELPCAVFDPVWEAGDDELALLVEETIDRCGLPSLKRGEVVVHRAPNYYPDLRVRVRPRPRGPGRVVARHPVRHARSAASACSSTTTPTKTMLIARDAVAALGDDGHFDRPRWEAGRQTRA